MCGKTTTEEFKRYYWKGDTSMRNIFIDENGEKSHEVCPTCYKHEEDYSKKWAKHLGIEV